MGASTTTSCAHALELAHQQHPAQHLKSLLSLRTSYLEEIIIFI